MIEVRCRTNLDLRNESWPEMLPAVPRVGDRIQSKTVHRGGFRLELEVCRVTWKCFGEKWIPEVEMHMTSWQKLMLPKTGDAAQGSLVAFYQWYAPHVGTTAGAFI